MGGRISIQLQVCLLSAAPARLHTLETGAGGPTAWGRDKRPPRWHAQSCLELVVLLELGHRCCPHSSGCTGNQSPAHLERNITVEGLQCPPPLPKASY